MDEFYRSLPHATCLSQQFYGTPRVTRRSANLAKRLATDLPSSEAFKCFHRSEIKYLALKSQRALGVLSQSGHVDSLIEGLLLTPPISFVCVSLLKQWNSDPVSFACICRDLALQSQGKLWQISTQITYLHVKRINTWMKPPCCVLLPFIWTSSGPASSPFCLLNLRVPKLWTNVEWSLST